MARAYNPAAAPSNDDVSRRQRHVGVLALALLPGAADLNWKSIKIYTGG